MVAAQRRSKPIPRYWHFASSFRAKRHVPSAHRTMTVPTFVSSFTGVHLRGNYDGRQTSPMRRVMPRCAMGDSIAPKIVITDTKSDATSKIKITWEPVLPNMAEAISVKGNMALAASLMSKSPRGSALPVADKGPVPEGMSPADFYYPKSSRNQAPVITFDKESGIAVSMDEINPVVGGIAANSVEKESVAFWKAKTYKYSAADLPPPQPDASDPISTSLFEKYYPSKLRNLAPGIEIRPPKGEWDTSAYIVVKNEYVGLNPALVAALDLPDVPQSPELQLKAVADKYYGKYQSYAPVISISREAETVEFGFEEIPLPDDAADLLSRRVKTMYA